MTDLTIVKYIVSGKKGNFWTYFKYLLSTINNSIHGTPVVSHIIHGPQKVHVAGSSRELNYLFPK